MCFGTCRCYGSGGINRESTRDRERERGKVVRWGAGREWGGCQVHQNIEKRALWKISGLTRRSFRHNNHHPKEKGKKKKKIWIENGLLTKSGKCNQFCFRGFWEAAKWRKWINTPVTFIKLLQRLEVSDQSTKCCLHRQTLRLWAHILCICSLLTSGDGKTLNWQRFKFL